MANVGLHTLRKEERLCSRKALEELFSGSHQSVSAFPLRAVYMANEVGLTRIMVSVSKRYFKRAVKRNRIKRQIREAYRLHKDLLYQAIPDNQRLLLAFVWLSDEHRLSKEVTQRVTGLMKRISEKL